MRIPRWWPALAFGVCCGPSSSPIAFDAALLERGVVPIAEDEPVLCTRLFVDLLGRRPIAGELEEKCLGRELDQVIVALTEDQLYQRTVRLRWSERLGYAHAELDRAVEALHRGELAYSQFIIETVTHPAFVGRYLGYNEQLSPAEAAFAAFLGRGATAPEARDLAELWRPWRPRYLEGPDVERTIWPLIDPYACEAGVHACASTIFGEAVLAFPRGERARLLEPEELTEQDWESLRVPGRLIASLPMAAEAAVDELIDRYLGWDLGAEFPEAREALAEEFLRSGGNYLALERTLLGSIAYRQKSDAENFAGPTKILRREAWLSSVSAFFGESLEPPAATGLDASIAEEQAIAAFCFAHPIERLIDRDAAFADVARRLLRRAHARDPAEEEVEELVAAARNGCPSCDVEKLTRDLCAAIIGGIEYVAY